MNAPRSSPASARPAYDRAAVRRLLLLTAATSCCAGCQWLGPKPHVGYCGDGVVQSEAGEQCDPPTSMAEVAGKRQTCSTLCRWEKCGDGTIDQDLGEECDDGADNDDNGDCTLACRIAVCGDGHLKTRGVLTPYERCDDGNRTNGDGCNPQCNLRGRVTVIGGTPGGMGNADGVGPAARFSVIRDMATDGKWIYFPDKGACAIRRFEIATGRVSTIAGRLGQCVAALVPNPGATARLSGNQKAIALAGQSLFVGEGPSLMRIDLSSDLFETTFCGTIAPDIDLLGITSLVWNPVDHRLYGSTLENIFALTLPCECDNTAKCNFKPLPGRASEIKFSTINSMALAPDGGALFIADFDHVRRLDLSTWEVTTVAGEHGKWGQVDGLGAAARFNFIWGLAMSGSGLYATDYSLEPGVDSPLTGRRVGWSTVRKLVAAAPGGAWTVSTIAGAGGVPPAGRTPEADGFGRFARFLDPRSLLISGDALFLGESASLRALSLSTGQVVTAAGVLVQDFSHYGAQAIVARAGSVYTMEGSGNLVEIPVATVGPNRRLGLCEDGAEEGQTHFIKGLAVDGDRIFVADQGYSRICRVTLAGGPEEGTPCCRGCKEKCTTMFRWKAESQKWKFLNIGGLAWDHDRQVFYLTRLDSGTIFRIGPGASDHEMPAPRMKAPMGVLVHDNGLFVADLDGNQVFRIDLADHHIRRLGAGGDDCITQDGPVEAAHFCHPAGLATDGTSLFVGESNGGVFQGHGIRQVGLGPHGQVTTLVGPGRDPFVVEGVGNRASVNRPMAMTWDPITASVYAVDAWDNVVLRID